MIEGCKYRIERRLDEVGEFSFESWVEGVYTVCFRVFREKSGYVGGCIEFSCGGGKL